MESRLIVRGGWAHYGEYNFDDVHLGKERGERLYFGIYGVGGFLLFV